MSGYVYAIANGGAVKIGWATDPIRRLSQLNIGSPDEHRLLGYVAATKAQERELHLLLSRWRIRGEWFSLSADAVLHFVSLLPSNHDREMAAFLELDPFPRAKAKVGGAAALAKLLGGITPQAVSQWQRVPAVRVLDVEKATGIPRHELRPDLYPPEPYEAAE